MALDSVDKKIIRCLQDNSRMNASAIGEAVNMSVSAVIERIKKLENSGVIKKYTVCLNEEKLGNDVLAFVEVSTEQYKYNEVISGVQKFVRNCPQILECHVVTGNSDILLKVVTESTKSLEKILNNLKEVRGVSYTRTAIVMSTLKFEVSTGLSE